MFMRSFSNSKPNKINLDFLKPKPKDSQGNQKQTSAQPNNIKSTPDKKQQTTDKNQQIASLFSYLGAKKESTPKSDASKKSSETSATSASANRTISSSLIKEAFEPFISSLQNQTEEYSEKANTDDILKTISMRLKQEDEEEEEPEEEEVYEPEEDMNDITTNDGSEFGQRFSLRQRVHLKRLLDSLKSKDPVMVKELYEEWDHVKTSLEEVFRSFRHEIAQKNEDRQLLENFHKHSADDEIPLELEKNATGYTPHMTPEEEEKRVALAKKQKEIQDEENATPLQTIKRLTDKLEQIRREEEAAHPTDFEKRLILAVRKKSLEQQLADLHQPPNPGKITLDVQRVLYEVSDKEMENPPSIDPTENRRLQDFLHEKYPSPLLGPDNKYDALFDEEMYTKQLYWMRSDEEPRHMERRDEANSRDEADDFEDMLDFQENQLVYEVLEHEDLYEEQEVNEEKEARQGKNATRKLDFITMRRTLYRERRAKRRERNHKLLLQQTTLQGTLEHFENRAKELKHGFANYFPDVMSKVSTTHCKFPILYAFARTINNNPTWPYDKKQDMMRQAIQYAKEQEKMIDLEKEDREGAT